MLLLAVDFVLVNRGRAQLVIEPFGNLSDVSSSFRRLVSSTLKRNLPMPSFTPRELHVRFNLVRNRIITAFADICLKELELCTEKNNKYSNNNI